MVLRILERGTVFEEVNLYSQQKTIATVVASQPSFLYYLSIQNLERMEAENPELAILVIVDEPKERWRDPRGSRFS